MLTLTRRTAPFASRTAFSRSGPSCLHGPHHGAQKSTMTGTSCEASMTSTMNVVTSLSLIRLASALGWAAPRICSIAVASPLYRALEYQLGGSGRRPSKLPPLDGRFGALWQPRPYPGPLLGGGRQADRAGDAGAAEAAIAGRVLGQILLVIVLG